MVCAIGLYNDDSLRISLFTCSAGDDLYSKFGHTGIRVQNASIGDDIVFNYGMFNYSSENFIWRFIMGYTDYELGAEITSSFIDRYKKEGIAVNEQILNITNKEAKNLYRALMINYMPANRIYRYDFLYDNCTTRAKEIIESSLYDAAILYDISSSDSLRTYRDMLHTCLKDNPWLVLGIDCLLGAEIDCISNTKNSIFLPKDLMNVLNNSNIKYDNGLCKKTVLSNNFIVKESNDLEVEATYKLGFLHPVFIFTCILLLSILLMVFEIKKGVVFWIFDIFIMSILGLSGLIVAFLFFFSKHPAVDSNWLVIVFNPLFLVWIPFQIYNNIWEKKSKLHMICFCILSLFVILIPFIPQEINISAILLILTMIIRNLSNVLVDSRIPNMYYDYKSKFSVS